MCETVSAQLMRGRLDSQGVVISSPLLRRKREPVVKAEPIVSTPLKFSSPDITKETPSSLIEELPNDVLAIVFSFVPLTPGLPMLLYVSKRWSKVIQEHGYTLWKSWFFSRDWIVRDNVKIGHEAKKRRRDWKTICHRHLDVERGWLTGQPHCIREIKHAHDRIIISIECDDTKIVSASLDKTVKIWDRSTIQPVRTIEHPAAVQCFQFKGNRLVSGAKDITIWDTDTGNCLYTHQSPFPCNALKFNSTDLVYGDSQAIHFCDLETGENKRILDESYLRALILQEDLLISGHMWDMKGWGIFFNTIAQHFASFLRTSFVFSLI